MNSKYLNPNLHLKIINTNKYHFTFLIRVLNLWYFFYFNCLSIWVILSIKWLEIIEFRAEFHARNIDKTIKKMLLRWTIGSEFYVSIYVVGSRVIIIKSHKFILHLFRFIWILRHFFRIIIFFLIIRMLSSKYNILLFLLFIINWWNKGIPLLF